MSRDSNLMKEPPASPSPVCVPVKRTVEEQLPVSQEVGVSRPQICGTSILNAPNPELQKERFGLLINSLKDLVAVAELREKETGIEKWWRLL